MDELKMVSLVNVGGGAAVEKFDEEFRKVLENILDPNTPAKAVRTISLDIKIKPNDNRDYCAVEIGCTSKMSAAKVFETQMFVGRDLSRGGAVLATEHNPRQMNMFEPNPAGKVAGVTEKGEKQ